METPTRTRRFASWRSDRRSRRARSEVASAAALEGPQIDIAPHDPLLAFLQQDPGPVEVDRLKLDSPAVRALREGGVKLIVPLVSQGELIGLLNLGPRLSEQEYSADDRKLLENLAGQAAPSLRVAQLVRENAAVVRSRERYEQEMRVAQLVQQNLLPKELPELSGWDLVPYYQPAREVGGDFYDFIPLPDGRMGFVVGDVTDKGVPAAIVMASTRKVLRIAAQQLIEPGAVLEQTNNELCPDMPSKMFVTCLYGILEPRTGRFVFANAGHNLPTIGRDSGVEEIRARGMPLGLMPGMTYEESETTIGPGEVILLYSDGLTEAHSPEGEMFGFPSVNRTVCRANRDRVIDELLDELHRFVTAVWEQEDDITLVSVRRTAAAAMIADRPDVEVAPIRGAGVGSAAPADPSSTPEGALVASFEVPSSEGNERLVIQQLEEEVGSLGLPKAKVDRIKTAVGEAAMNAIEHGNHNQPEVPVKVEAYVSPRALTVRITDRGRYTPIDQDPEVPDLDAKLAGMQTPRGWGLFLIRNMVDEMRVFGDDDHNTVELVVHLEGEGS